MLAIKYTPNIFLIIVFVSSFLQQDMLSVCVLKNWKQLFSSKLILYLVGQEHSIYFSFLTRIFTRYLQNFRVK